MCPNAATAASRWMRSSISDSSGRARRITEPKTRARRRPSRARADAGRGRSPRACAASPVAAQRAALRRGRASNALQPARRARSSPRSRRRPCQRRYGLRRRRSPPRARSGRRRRCRGRARRRAARRHRRCAAPRRERAVRAAAPWNPPPRHRLKQRVPICASNFGKSFRHGQGGAYDRLTMGRLVRKRGLVTFVVLVVIAEVVGRSLIGHVDRLLHVEPLARPDSSYYPFLLLAVKTVGAVALAGLLAPGTRAWARADAGHRLLAAAGEEHERRAAPRLRANLSLRVGFGAFAATSVLYLVHTDADGFAAGRWTLFAPWLHTYSLPIFAGLAFAIAIVWRFARWP